MPNSIAPRLKRLFRQWRRWKEILLTELDELPEVLSWFNKIRKSNNSLIKLEVLTYRMHRVLYTVYMMSRRSLNLIELNLKRSPSLGIQGRAMLKLLITTFADDSNAFCRASNAFQSELRLLAIKTLASHFKL